MQVKKVQKKRLSKAEKARIKEILFRLDTQYGTDYKCYLEHENPWQLLIATILSAQCTDARVNIVTKDLFVKYPTLEAFAAADVKELEQDIRSTGFYHNKAKNIIACTKTLIEKYNGQVPQKLEDLTSLAGVGRKTANVIRGNIYYDPSIVVDTHVKRISKKLGLTKEDDPVIFLSSSFYIAYCTDFNDSILFRRKSCCFYVYCQITSYHLFLISMQNTAYN